MSIKFIGFCYQLHDWVCNLPVKHAKDKILFALNRQIKYTQVFAIVIILLETISELCAFV